MGNGTYSSVGHFGYTSPDYVGPSVWTAPSTSGSTAIIGTPVVFQTGPVSSDGLHPYETFTAELPHRFVVHAVHPDTLHFTCDWAVVVCAVGLIVVNRAARVVNRVRLRRWLMQPRL